MDINGDFLPDESKIVLDAATSYDCMTEVTLFRVFHTLSYPEVILASRAANTCCVA